MVVIKHECPELRTLYVYLTEGCNCACRHCWIVPERGSKAAGAALLEPEVLRQAIEQALPLGLTSLKWTGGEPTYHPRFIEFLRLQKKFGLTSIIETNGMLIDEKLAAQMRDHGVDRPSVSLDGAIPATHDSIRGVVGGFARTLAGIRALVAAGYRPELILTLQKINRDELAAFFELAESLGAGSVKLNILQPVLRGATLTREGEGLGIRELLDVELAIKTERSRRPELPILMDLPMAFRPLSKILSGEDDGACNIRHVLGILPHGTYALCGIGQHVAELVMGTVATSNLAELWQKHPVLLGLRDGLPEKLQGICRDCLMKSVCLGSCVAANYQCSGDLLAPYWFCRQAAEMGLFPASRRRLLEAKN